MTRRVPQLPSRALPIAQDSTAEVVRREQSLAIADLQKQPSAGWPRSARAYLGRRVIGSTSAGSPSPGTRAILLRMCGAGGGGGGVTGGVGTLDASSGGSSGVYMEKWIDANIGNFTITIGAAGAAGSAGGGAGGTGGDTSFTMGGITYTCRGGLGGIALGAGSTTGFQAHTAIQAGSSSGDFELAEGGLGGMRIAASSALAGKGGSIPIGGGGVTNLANVDGTPGNGYGSGGGGAVATVTNRAGGAGRPGVVILEEYT